MPGPSAPDPELVAFALQMLKDGHSYRKTAGVVGVHANTLKRWQADPEKWTAPRAPDSHAAAVSPETKARIEAVTARANAAAQAPEPAPLAPMDPNATPLDFGRQMIIEARQRSADAHARGDFTTAAREAKNAAGLVNMMARIGAKSDGDGLTFTRAEIAKAEATVLERVKATLDRPLLCAHCSRELSIEYGRLVDGASAVAKTDDQPH